MKSPLRLALMGALALALAACASDEASTGGGGTGDTDAGTGAGGNGGGAGGNNGGGGAACQSDFQCGVGRVCDRTSGSCVTGACNVERTCDQGQRCDTTTYTCIGDANPPCATDADCAGAGLAICDPNGECRQVQCRSMMDCDPGERCSETNNCVPDVQTCIDGDNDGYGEGASCMGPDCDDNNPMVNPGVVENGQMNCDDGIDNDCSGGDVICGAADGDGDGFTDLQGDCDDANPNVNPDAGETPYNGVDDDCDERTRDDDLDGDGYGQAEDCEDRAAHINPEAVDIPGDGIDQDCSGADAEVSNDDLDGDGVSSADGDCNDENPSISPNLEEIPYDGVDNDCNNETPDNDLDEDGFEAPADCDDMNRAINPNAAEVYYNGADDDCNAETIDDDQDADGFPQAADCNDESAAVNPDAMEQPGNGIDDDCDPATSDEAMVVDADGDGVNADEDCDDNNPEVFPGAVEDGMTNCGDGIDNDCRGGDVECGVPDVDADGDGVPDDADCEPNNAEIPGPREIANNGLDDDCNPETPDQCDDDAFDMLADNGASANATGVEDGDRTGVQYGDLFMCAGDEDWYRIQVEAGDGLEFDIFHAHADGDLDVELFRADAQGTLQFVDGSYSVSDNETVYERRSTAGATYYARVYGFRGASAPYQMTVNVFEQCTDDVEGSDGEHNDNAGEGGRFPAPTALRRICDYDEDWYTFTVEQQQQVRIDVLHDYAFRQSDIELGLYREGGEQRIGFSTTITDNEAITMNLMPGTYHARVYAAGDDVGSYRIILSSGNPQTERREETDDQGIPDFEGGQPGELRTPLVFNQAPENAVIRQLTVRDMDVNHDWHRDLLITAWWNGEQIAVLWNREGGPDGNDGGFDDDFLPFTGGDINFDNRVYREFEGLPARGTFELVIQDLGPDDTGDLASIDVEIEYLTP
ncbi:MAG: PPC domain-containing protein [Planctomycetota bacterium]